LTVSKYIIALANLWFQMDEALLYYTKIITDFLNLTFAGGWIERFGLITWPSRSPDLFPNDFFGLSQIKSIQKCSNPKYTRAVHKMS